MDYRHPLLFLLSPHRFSAGAVAGPRATRLCPISVLEDPGYLLRLSVGSRSLRGIFLPGLAAAVDRGLDRPAAARASRRVGALRRRAPALSRFPQLEAGVGGRNLRTVLWNRLPQSREH